MSAVPEPGHQLASAISEDPGHAPGFSFATLECPSRVDGSIPSLATTSNCEGLLSYPEPMGGTEQLAQVTRLNAAFARSSRGLHLNGPRVLVR